MSKGVYLGRVINIRYSNMKEIGRSEKGDPTKKSHVDFESLTSGPSSAKVTRK